MGEMGHDVDNCFTLKIKVQNLIDRGLLDFKEPEPNVHQNPLPDHQGVNLIQDDDSDDEYEAQRQRRRRADRRFMEEAIANGETIALLGDNGGNYRFMVRLTPPAWSRDPNYVTKPDGWGGMDEIAELNVEIPKTEPTFDIELMVDFQDKLKVTPEVLTEKDDEGVGESGERSIEDPPKKVHQENPEDSTDEGLVAMITPFVIELHDGDNQDKFDVVQKPATIVFPDDAIEREKVRPFVIELPPKEKFDTRAAPWDYSVNEISTITRSGGIFLPSRTR